MASCKNVFLCTLQEPNISKYLMHTVYFFIAYQTEATEQMTSQQTITCNIIFQCQFIFTNELYLKQGK